MVLHLSPADESAGAKRNVAQLANACGNGAMDDRPASGSGALGDGVRSSLYLAINQVTVQTVAVIGSVAHQSFRETVEEAVSEDTYDKLGFRATKRFRY